MYIPTFDTTADREVIPEGLPSPIAPAAGDVTGVEANHSSQVASVAPSDQWDDDEDSLSAGLLPAQGYDPNISGPHPTQGVEDRRAGGMNGAYGGMQAMDCADDYLSWLPAGGEGMADSVAPLGTFDQPSETIAGIQVFPIVRRA